MQREARRKKGWSPVQDGFLMGIRDRKDAKVEELWLMMTNDIYNV